MPGTEHRPWVKATDCTKFSIFGVYFSVPPSIMHISHSWASRVLWRWASLSCSRALKPQCCAPCVAQSAGPQQSPPGHLFSPSINFVLVQAQQRQRLTSHPFMRKCSPGTRRVAQGMRMCLPGLTGPSCEGSDGFHPPLAETLSHETLTPHTSGWHGCGRPRGPVVSHASASVGKTCCLQKRI